MIAIIAILAAILFPVFARARENARRSSCASNLKQLALATIQYTQDYDDRLPTMVRTASGVNLDGGWVYMTAYDASGVTSQFDVTRGSLYPYVKNAQVYLCPSDTIGQQEGLSYVFGECMAKGAPPYYQGQSLAAFPAVSSTIMLSSTGPDSSSSNNDGYGLLYVPSAPLYTSALATSSRHLGTENIAFLDGHVKAYNPFKAYPLLWGGPEYTSCP